MRRYKVHYVHRSFDGSVSTPIGDVDLNAVDDDDAKRKALELVAKHKLDGANAFTLLSGTKPIFQDFLDANHASRL